MEQLKKDNEQTENERELQPSAQTQEKVIDGAFGKFRSADALLQAYNSLQSEFTRRSQRLKELENEKKNNLSQQAEPVTAQTVEEPSSSSTQTAIEPDETPVSDTQREKIIAEYLEQVKKSAVPLVRNGVSVHAPTTAPKSIQEAGALALGYLQK